jgi:Amt family ammonium transporter
MVQVIGVLTTVVWCGSFTYIILKVVDGLTGLRISDDDEETGIDLTEHGERGYND